MNSFSDADRAAIHAALDVLLHMAGALTREDLFDFYAETDREFCADDPVAAFDKWYADCGRPWKDVANIDEELRNRGR